ncbi:hypothetical protein PbDSM24746_43250 [Paenibacillus macerans]|nr:hypothetical protein PbDSM24746_43250 [Paenibacillus macerans]GBK70511.1 hypothetical protein PbJCM17693_42190 [Paenibacillus macerans]GIP13604.1 hypothetical protein J1TS5_57740 [Paenibacillus macerans]
MNYLVQPNAMLPTDNCNCYKSNYCSGQCTAKCTSNCIAHKPGCIAWM